MVRFEEDLLRRLAVNDERSLRTVMALRTDCAQAEHALDAALTPRVKMLVCLAALIALDSSTTSLRWAAELASCAGADEDELVGVLGSIASEVGVPCVVRAAPRLALAIGYETDVTAQAAAETLVPR